MDFSQSTEKLSQRVGILPDNIIFIKDLSTIIMNGST